MHKFLTLAWVLLLFILPNHLFAQVYAIDNSVQLEAISQTLPNEVILNWKSHASATGYSIHRKLPNATSWGTTLATLTASDSTYTDNTITAGTLYEYRVTRQAPTTAFGYVISGVDTKLTYNNGIMILVVDSFFIPALNIEINQLVSDYEADGYYVKQLHVNRNQSVASVKSSIVSLYGQDPANTNAIMLLGHIPVPYSGLINPDGHPDHLGAWPADAYYAEMNSVWTDVSVNDNTSASDSRNHNVPGDGKFDQNIIPSPVELQCGRVDFYNLPSFTETETQLMQQYLNKLHAFKMRQFIPQDKAIIEDNFSAYAEGFSSSGYKNFSSLVGIDNILSSDWLATLDTMNILWSYGCGPGWYQGASGIATTTDFVNDSVLSVFNMLFGSYFGDWDVTNSFLRSALASGNVLTNVWSGRPHWQFHQMGMGYPIGYSAKNTMSLSTTYYTSSLASGYFGRWVHIALLGDPALRMHYIAPASNLTGSEDGNNVIHLNWTASSEVIDGYYVYRKLPTDIHWTQLNSTIVSGTTYNDSSLVSGGDYVYMVRAARSQTTASGTYENLSLGTTTLIGSHASIEMEQTKAFNIYPNPTYYELHIEWFDPITTVEPLTIYDELGRMIRTVEIPTGLKSYIIYLEDLSPGKYHLHWNHSTATFIKLN